MSLDVKKFIDGLHDYLGRAFAPFNSRIAALEEKVAALEEGPAETLADAYRGAWLPGKYARGCLVTHAGSLWLAVEDAEGKPGSTPSWRLVVKSGRDL